MRTGRSCASSEASRCRGVSAVPRSLGDRKRATAWRDGRGTQADVLEREPAGCSRQDISRRRCSTISAKGLLATKHQVELREIVGHSRTSTGNDSGPASPRTPARNGKSGHGMRSGPVGVTARLRWASGDDPGHLPGTLLQTSPRCLATPR